MFLIISSKYFQLYNTHKSAVPINLKWIEEDYCKQAWLLIYTTKVKALYSKNKQNKGTVELVVGTVILIEE